MFCRQIELDLHHYWNDASWNAVRTYVDKGGKVFYTMDEMEPNNVNALTNKFLTGLLGQPLLIAKPSENYGVYKFTDTQEGENDVAILDGVFGDVRPYYWGQDRVGTGYINGYTGNDVIVYSNHAQNMVAPSPAGMSFFRHKTKSFFFIGDGGFFLTMLQEK